MFESGENTIVRAAALSHFVCVDDAMNRAGLCGKSIKYFKKQPSSSFFFFFLFLFCSPLLKSEATWLLPEELKFEANTKLPFFVCIKVIE